MTLLLQIIGVFFSAFHTVSARETYVFDDSVGLGRKFDGLGAISGGGATSKLLMNYPKQQRDEILDYVFKPNFGAALHLLKVEIGSDGQSTEGSEACHMRSPNEENYERGYEWWIMKEAKKRNPDIQLIGLPWAWPGWLGGKSGNVYADPEQTAMYIIKWILGAKSKHNLHIDYIGIWNESHYNITYIKVLRRMLNANGLQDTLIVAADDINDFDVISSQVLADPELADAIYAIGVHYPNTESSMLAMDTGKPLWASEDHPGELFLRWNLNYLNGFMSGTVIWPLLSSFYMGLPWNGAGFLNASEPWSGHYTVPDFLYTAAHTTQFTKPGWWFLKHGVGVARFRSAGAYVALTSPDRKDLTIIIESVEDTLPGPITGENVTLELKGTFANIKQLNFWLTQFNPKDMDNSSVFEKQQPVLVKDGKVNLTIGMHQIITLTTLTCGAKGSYPTPPPSKPFPLPFAENFESFNESEEPYNIAPQTGAFEVRTVTGSHGKVMRQVTWQRPVSWIWSHAEEAGVSLAVIGEYFWSDIYIECEIYINLTSPVRSEGAYIAARVNHGGCDANNNTGLYLYVYPENKTYIFSGDIERKTVLTKGAIPMSSDWNKISLQVQKNTATATINGAKIFHMDTIPPSIKSGFVGLGSGSWGAVDFDNLLIRERS